MKKRNLKILFVVAVSLLTLMICTFSSNAAVLGDVDGDDNIVTASDARIILRASVGLENFTSEQKKLADINEDGNISAEDARTALRISVSLEDTLHFYKKKTVTAATCTEKGLIKATCTECDDVYEKEVDALGHDFDVEVIKAVSCKTDGLEKRTCTRKGCGLVEEKVIKKLKHSPDRSAATCTKDKVCTVGNHVMEKKLGHTTDWGICGNCNKFATTKYKDQAKTIKTKFTEAEKAFNKAYKVNNYNIMLAQGPSWAVPDNTKKAKPNYVKAKAAYEAALAACGDTPEFAAIKVLLQKNIDNITSVLAQVDIILKEPFVDIRNYETLIWPLEEINDFNSDSITATNKKLSAEIKW